MFVLPTSMTRSMGAPSLSLLDCGRADRVPLGERPPVPFGVADARVLAVEVRDSGERDEELARAGVAAGERDADVERAERNGRSLAPEQGAGASVAVAVRIAELG